MQKKKKLGAGVRHCSVSVPGSHLARDLYRQQAEQVAGALCASLTDLLGDPLHQRRRPLQLPGGENKAAV